MKIVVEGIAEILAYHRSKIFCQGRAVSTQSVYLKIDHVNDYGNIFNIGCLKISLKYGNCNLPKNHCIYSNDNESYHLNHTVA